MRAIGYNPTYHAFLSGSDQIWNGHRFTVQPHHFLRFAPMHKRIAWAPSIGTSDIAPYNRRLYKKYISQYAALSVRESTGIDIVCNLTGRTPVQLIDPVFLLTQEDWSVLTNENTYGKYALCYFLDEPNVETINKIDAFCKREQAMPIVLGSIREAYKPLSGCLAVDGGPKEFVSMIKNAYCLFTDSFHGVSFSAIFHTPFFAFRRNYMHGIDQSSRLISILGLFHMEHTFEPTDTSATDYDFSYSDSVIAEKRSNMLDYLTTSIKNVEKRKL